MQVGDRPLNADMASFRTPTNEVVTDSKSATTFVQVDTNAFKEVVQRLTGSSVAPTNTVHDVGTTITKGGISIRKPAFKLHERRQYKAKLEIIKPSISFRQGSSSIRSPNQQKFSPSPLSTPTECFSKLSLFEREIEESSVSTDLNTKEEERAIREKKFYLHPSPRTKKLGLHEPKLLNLFPLTSPTTPTESHEQWRC